MSLPRRAANAAAGAAGFVLAGGQSSRMGSDKALMALDGKPLVGHALEILRRAGLPASIAGARSQLQPFAAVIGDAGAGPLSGICAALASTQAEYAVFLSVDMPLLPATLVVHLVEHAQITESAVTVASVGGFAQTFPAVVQRVALAALQATLAGDNLGCFAAFRAVAADLRRPFAVVAVENLVQSGQVEEPRGIPPAFWFLNLNTPADLTRAESLLGSIHRSIA